MKNKPMATPVTQKELANMVFWQKPENGGHVFRRGDVIPDSTLVGPQKRLSAKELLGSVVVALVIIALAYVDSVSKGLL